MSGPAGDFGQFLLWERSSRDTIEVKRAYIDMAGDLAAGIVLSQIVYWHLPSRDGRTRLRVKRDGHLWLAKGRADWWAECRVSPKQADRALAVLEQRGSIEVRLVRFAGAPTKHVRIVPEAFLRGWSDHLDAGSDDFDRTAKSTSPVGEVHLPRRARRILPEREEPTTQRLRQRSPQQPSRLLMPAWWTSWSATASAGSSPVGWPGGSPRSAAGAWTTWRMPSTERRQGRD